MRPIVPPRWLADEMVGRLARYLRFFGHDTEYVRGENDEAVARRAIAEDRVVLTRDRRLAEQTPRVILLTSSALADQLRQVRVAAPEAGYVVKFDRCTLCNGSLLPWTPGPEEPLPPSLSRERLEKGLSLFRCEKCKHTYWDGSHTEQIRRQLQSWGISQTP